MTKAGNTPTFTFTLKGEEHLDLQVLRFKGTEALSQPYEITIDLVTRRSSIDLESLLNKEAYPLPDQKTQSVFRSRSTPNSTGFNELALEDKSGEERIYVRAQRDMEQNIQNDSHIQIGNKRLENIKGDSTSVLEAKEERTTTGERAVQLLAGDNLQVATNSHTRVGQVLVAEAGQEIHFKSNANIVLNAGISLSISAGGNHITIGPGGIFASSLILLGGAPIPGTPAAPLAPGGVAARIAPAELPPVMASNQRSFSVRAKAVGPKTCPLCEACREGFCNLEGAAA